ILAEPAGTRRTPEPCAAGDARLAPGECVCLQRAHLSARSFGHRTAQRMAGFCVEFEIADEDRFRRLAAVFDALRAAKQSDAWRDDDYWLGFFDAESRSRFWWPTPAEQEDWNRRWFSTPVPQRFTDPSLVTPWYF